MSQTESPKGGKKRIELNKNENTTHQNSLDTGKVVLKGRFTAQNEYSRENEKFQIKNTYVLTSGT